MICSGGSRANWRFFAKHLTNARDNERVQMIEYRGTDSRSVLDAFREMDMIASGTRGKNFFYHADLNPREDERLTPEQWEQAVDTLEKHLGLEGQPRFVIEHEKKGRVHRHVVWSRIDADSMTAISDSNNFAKHAAASREIERAFDLEPVRNILAEPDGPRPERRPKNWETFRGHKSGIDPQEVKAEVTELWRRTGTGKAFRIALAQRGYVLARGDRRDYVIVDRAGHEHSLARRIEGAKAADIRKRLADLDQGALPRVGAGRKERRDDKQKVTAAVSMGANRKRVETVINATRASAVSPHEPHEAANRDAQDWHEAAVQRAHAERSAKWQQRVKQKERERER